MTPDAHRSPASAAGGKNDGNFPDLLLAEPDEDLAAAAMLKFDRAGVKTIVCHDGAEALLQVGAHHPRAVLLGAPLPVVGAAEVTELIARLHPVPVIVGAGGDGAGEAMAALTAGAVAFVARPYRTEEILPFLIPRPKAGSDEALVVGDIELDPVGFHVYVRGRSIQLPVREFMLLRYLMENANRMVTRAELTKALWGVKELDSNSLTVHVRRVRNRLKEGSGTCCTIDAIRGMGYRLECKPTPSAGSPGLSMRPSPTA